MLWCKTAIAAPARPIRRIVSSQVRAGARRNPTRKVKEPRRALCIVQVANMATCPISAMAGLRVEFFVDRLAPRCLSRPISGAQFGAAQVLVDHRQFGAKVASSTRPFCDQYARVREQSAGSLKWARKAVRHLESHRAASADFGYCGSGSPRERRQRSRLSQREAFPLPMKAEARQLWERWICL